MISITEIAVIDFKEVSLIINYFLCKNKLIKNEEN